MIYFVRHGEAWINVWLKEKRALDLSEAVDTPLTDSGQKQAEATAERLKDTDFDVIITSDLARAKQTAEAIRKFHKDVPVVVLPELNERRDMRTMSVGQDQEVGWSESFVYGLKHAEGIEPLDDFVARVVNGIKYIEQNYSDKNALVVAHGGVGHVFRRYFSGKPWTGNLVEKKMANGEVEEFTA